MISQVSLPDLIHEMAYAWDPVVDDDATTTMQRGLRALHTTPLQKICMAALGLRQNPLPPPRLPACALPASPAGRTPEASGNAARALGGQAISARAGGGRGFASGGQRALPFGIPPGTSPLDPIGEDQTIHIVCSLL